MIQETFAEFLCELVLKNASRCDRPQELFSLCSQGRRVVRIGRGGVHHLLRGDLLLLGPPGGRVRQEGGRDHWREAKDRRGGTGET